MDLIRFVYASVARPGLDYGELTSLLRIAGPRNAQQGITGILCVGNGAFLQALEGDRTVVNRLYNAIVADPRHSGCAILRYGRITTRTYAEWSMKLVGLDDQPTGRRWKLVLRHAGSTVFAPLEMTGAQASALLEDLAHEERRAA
jgi:hypothetical protein